MIGQLALGTLVVTINAIIQAEMFSARSATKAIVRFANIATP